MRVLLVAGNFEPAGGAASILVTRTARELVERGHEVTVLTSHLDGKSDPFAESPVPGLRVIRDADRHRLPRRAVRKLWWQAVRRWPSWRNIPDQKFEWAIFSAKRAREVMESVQPDVVYSRSYPFSSHLIARRLRRATSVPWVAHFGDPLVGHPYLEMNRATKRLNLWIERRIYETADALIFTNKVQQDLMLGPHSPGLAAKAHILPPYFDPENSEAARQPGTGSRSTSVVIAHIGRLYGLRSPEGLLRALALVRERNGGSPGISMFFVGKVGRFTPEHGSTGEESMANLVKELGLEDVVHVVGEVTYEESLRWMADADILVSIDAPVKETSPFIPSKLVPYAAAGKPVLNLTPAGSASGQFTGEMGGLSAPPDDPESIATAINTIIATKENEFRPFRPRPEVLQRFTVSAVHDHLEGIFSGLSRSTALDHTATLQCACAGVRAQERLG